LVTETIKYFAYGMNTNRADLQRRCACATMLGIAVLENHRLDFNIHADITQEQNSSVHGVLWAISSQCLEQLDMLEGYPEYYTRREATVLTAQGPVVAWVYEMLPQHKNFLSPGIEYFHTVLEGYQQTGLPTQQLHQALSKAQQYERGQL